MERAFIYGTYGFCFGSSAFQSSLHESPVIGEVTVSPRKLGSVSFVMDLQFLVMFGK